MSRRLDVCVENILARMTLEDEQRLAVEVELHGHLDDLINECGRRGLDVNEAEAEAIRHFDDAPLLARLYNLSGGRYWRIVQRSIPMAFISLLLFLGYKDPVVFGIMWLGLTAIRAYPILRVKAGVDHGLILSPLLRPSRRIDWNRITRVRLESGHLFGARRIVIEYDGGKIAMPASAHGMRAAALALRAMRPEIIEPGALEYLLRFHSALVYEPIKRRLLASMGWLWILASYSLVFRVLWDGIGYPNGSIGLLPVLLIVPYQTRRLPDRPRAAVLNLLITILSFATLATLGASVFGNVYFVRQMVIISMMCMALGLMFTWWRAGRIALLITMFLAAGVFLDFRDKAKPEYLENQLTYGVIQLPYSEFTWLDGGESAAYIDARTTPTPENPQHTDYTLVIAKPGIELRRIALPVGNYWFIPPRPGTRLTLLSMPANSHLKESTIRTITADDRIDSMTLPFAVTPLYNSDSPWSPDGKYIYPGSPGGTSFLVDMSAKKFTTLSQRGLGAHIRWLDANRFKTCVFHNSTTATVTSIRIFETDVRTGISKLSREFQLKRGETPDFLDGLHYALVQHTLIDLETGKRIELPLATLLRDRDYKWEPRSERIAYAADEVGEDSKGNTYFGSLVVFDPTKGIVDQLDFDTPEKIRGIRLSPNGNQLLFNHSSCVNSVPSLMSLMHTEVWDLKTGKRHWLFTHNMISAILLEISASDLGIAAAPCWSPDGNEVVYPTIDLLQIARKNMNMSFILARP